MREKTVVKQWDVDRGLLYLHASWVCVLQDIRLLMIISPIIYSVPGMFLNISHKNLYGSIWLAVSMMLYTYPLDSAPFTLPLNNQFFSRS